MSFWTMFREYCKRVRIFYNLQKDDKSQSLEGRRENSIFPKKLDDKTEDTQKTISSSSNDIKIIDVKAEVKTIERK